MILRWVTLVGLIAFCGWQLYFEMTAPGPVYFPIIYVFVPILLVIGLDKKGVFTWPIATILLLLEGHWIVGWIPGVFVIVNMIVLERTLKKQSTYCPVCDQLLISGQDIKELGSFWVHAGKCYEVMESEYKKGW